MKRTMIFIFSVVGLLILFRIGIVRNFLDNLFLTKHHKSYNYIYNSVESENYILEKIINDNLNSFDSHFILFDKFSEKFFVKTNEPFNNEYVLWKIDNKGNVIDSITSHSLLPHSGVYFAENHYVDWVISGNKSKKNYDSIINYDSLTKSDFKNLLEKATVVDFAKIYGESGDSSKPDKGRCFLKVQEKWLVIESKRMFEELERDYSKDTYEIIHKEFKKKNADRLISISDSIKPFYKWDNQDNFVYKQKFVRKKYRSARFYDINNTSRSGWDGTGYFCLVHNYEDINFKAYGFQYSSFGYINDGSFSPDISIYFPDKKSNIDLVFVKLGDLAQYEGRDRQEVGLYVLKKKH